MKTYIGTKVIKARPMTKQEYCDYRGWDVPANENTEEEIYLVEYEKDENSKPNHPDHEGYISMSPKHVFDKSYKIAEDWKDRLHIERDNLSDNISKLSSAIAMQTVPAETIPMLQVQLAAMETYRQVLRIRLKS